MADVLAFDLGGVLFSDGTRDFLEYAHQAYGVDRALAADLLHGALGSAYREGKLTRYDFWSAFRRALDLSASTDALEARWIDSYHLNESTRALIEELSRTHDVYYLSDNVAERVEAVERRYGFLRLFTGGVFS